MSLTINALMLAIAASCFCHPYSDTRPARKFEATDEKTERGARVTETARRIPAREVDRLVASPLRDVPVWRPDGRLHGRLRGGDSDGLRHDRSP